MDYTISQEKFEEQSRECVRSFYETSTGVNQDIKLEFVACDAESKTLVLKHHAIKSETNPLGTLHGGVTAWLLDTAMGMVNVCYLGKLPTPTINMSINYIQAIKEGDECIITSQIDRIGKKVLDVHGEIRVNGQIVARAIGTNYRLD